MNEDVTADGDWVATACTLPTVEQPLRGAEFDALFAHDLIGVTQESPRRVRLELRAEPAVAARAADLAVKEVECCSFFSFGLAITNGHVALAVEAGPAHETVLAALAARAESRLGAGA